MPLSKDHVRASKLLSYLLRHRPDSVGLTLSAGGWIDVDRLLEACRSHGHELDRPLLEAVVAGSDKRRFELSAGGACIRAVQGHSVAVDLGLPPTEPPERLYHGTVERFLDSILRHGLRPGERNHVHLSPDVETAAAVGRRRGRPVILEVAAGDMQRAGHEFFVAKNGVWLTARVPAEFLRRCEHRSIPP